ncbi:MAG: hypothetical protein K6G30_09055 [Acetatifactor sp.]|nr:hypothetical protein [Acetatifactor sp.]
MALAIGFIVLLIVTDRFPIDYNIETTDKFYLAGKPDNPFAMNSEADFASGNPFEAYVCNASDVDFGSYTAVDCQEVSASNFLQTSRGVYPAEKAFDGDLLTCWQDGVDGYGEGTELYAKLSEASDLQYIVFINGQARDDERFKKNGRVCQLEIGDGNYTVTVNLPDENVPTAIKLNGWNNVSELHFRIISVYPGSDYEDTCISEITCFK